MKEILWPLNYIINVVVGSIEYNNPIIQVKIIIKSKQVHSPIIDKSRLIAIIFIIVLLFILPMVLHLVVGFIVALLTSEAQVEVLLLVVLNQTYLGDVLAWGETLAQLGEVVVVVGLVLVVGVLVVLDVLTSHHVVSRLAADD